MAMASLMMGTGTREVLDWTQQHIQELDSGAGFGNTQIGIEGRTKSSWDIDQWRICLTLLIPQLSPAYSKPIC